MVNGIRLQKPSPKAFAVAVGPAPMASAARLTMRMARAANTQESGNQRSAQFEQRMAKRAERLSWMGRIAVIADSLGFIVIRRLRGRLCVLRLLGTRPSRGAERYGAGRTVKAVRHSFPGHERAMPRERTWRDHAASGRSMDQSRARVRATPCPPPMHRVARPFFASRRIISCSRVTSTRQPDAPIGWPRAMAPPLTLTLAASQPSSRPTARDCAAKASLASIRSSCSRLQPALSSARRVAETGPMPMIAGSTPALA